MHNSPNSQSNFDRQIGFSLVEVLVAFSILMIILFSVLQSRLGSIRRIEQTGDLNQIQDRVRADLANIRKQALKWHCVGGTACSGLLKDQHNPSRYTDLHCNSPNPLVNFPIQTEVLISENDNIELTRNVEFDGNQLNIIYSGQAGDKTFNTSTSIIPQAMSWCG